MMVSRRIALLVLGALIAFSAASPVTSAWADDRAGALEMGKPGGSTENCRSKHEGKLLAVIIPCIEDVLRENAEFMTDQFDEYVKPGAYAFMVLVLTIFGVKIVSGEGDAKKDSIMLLFKMAGVILFIENFGGFIPAAFGMVDDGVQMVTGSLGTALSEMECDAEQYGGKEPWRYMDCILGELFGFAPNVVIGSSLFGLMGSAMFSGSLGATLFMGGILALFLVVKLVLRGAYTYLMAMMVLTFLIIISPLLIPLLLTSATFQYFENWLKSLIATMVQPMIMLCYITFAFLLLDKMLYNEEMGLAKQLPKEEIEKYWNGKNSSGKVSVMNNPGAFYKKLMDIDPEWIKKNYGDNPVNPAFAGTTAVDWWSEMYSFDFRGEGVDKTKKVFFSMMALVLMAYLLDSMLQSIASMSQQILGSGFALSKASGEGSILEQKLDQAFNATKNTWSGSAGDKGGVDGVKGFLSGGAEGIKAGMKSLVGGR